MLPFRLAFIIVSDLESRLKAFVIIYLFILPWKLELEGVLPLIVMLLLRLFFSLILGWGGRGA